MFAAPMSISRPILEPPPAPAPVLLSLQEAVQRGYGAYSTLRRYIAEGRLPAVKVGSRVKIRQADLAMLAVPASPAMPEDHTVTGDRPCGDELGDYVKRLVDAFPALTPARRAALGRLLDAGA